MSTPTEAEMAALGEAGPLLRFASEHVEGLDPSLSRAIAEAVDANQNQQWNPEISQRFWQAFSQLCNLIKPVTMECLAAARRNVEARSWLRVWRKGQSYSIAERTSSRYLILVGFLLSVVTLLQLYVWVSTNLSKQLDELVKNLTVEAAQLSAVYTPIASVKDPSPDQATQQEKVKADADSLQSDAERALYYGYLLQRWSAQVGNDLTLDDTDATGGAANNQWLTRYESAMTAVQTAKTRALRAEVNANLISGTILSFFLPILFGAIGAAAYVIRMISDQIRNTTFSNTSPVRHLMRLMLGALMGVVIGLFSGLSAQLSLPPLALAFLAGYGVEAVFSMFDVLVERFRQPQPIASHQSQQSGLAVGQVPPSH